MCMRTAYILALVSVLGSCVSATTYYVDTASMGSGDGTSQATSGARAAWKDISQIAGLAPGDTVLLRRGRTWTEELDVTVSGTRDHPITFAAYGSGENPIITASRQRDYCIEVSDEDYIIIDGIDCQYARLQNIVLYKADYCIVRNLTSSYALRDGVRICYGNSTGNLIENVTAHHNGEVDHGGGILLDTGVTRNIVRFCTCYQNAEDGTGSGGWPGNYAGPDNIFEYNDCYDNHESGMDVKSGPQIIRFNKLHDNHGTYDNEGEGIALTYEARNVEIYGNEIYDNDWNGIRISTSNVGGGHIIAYNRIYNNAKRGIYGEGTSSSNKIRSNLIYDNAVYGVLLRTPETEVHKNIIWGNGNHQLRILSAYNTVRNNVLGGSEGILDIAEDGHTELTFYSNCIIEAGNVCTLDWSFYNFDFARWPASRLLYGNLDSQDLGVVVAVDGSSLYFHSDRPGGMGGFDLWTTVRDMSADNWAEPNNMSKIVNSPYDDEWPCISEDGLTLLFSSNRREGLGGYDLWMTTRPSPTNNWNPSVNLGSAVNSEGSERRSWVSAGGRMIVYESHSVSGSLRGVETYDLHMASRGRSEGAWQRSTWLAKAINVTFDDDGLCFIGGGPATYFVSERPDGGWYLWQTSLMENPDFHQHSVVDFRDLLLGDPTSNGGDSDPSAYPIAEGFETGDFDRFDWTSFGDAEWAVTSSEHNSGTYSAKAGSIEDYESTTLKVTLDCMSGEISFYCKVSSESYFDYLTFYIDGTRYDAWSGDKDWTEKSFPVESGRRVFEWKYSKDRSYSYSSDTAWIDDIVFPILVNDHP
ncbi:MAG: right-handed parallel beta-helix repeat-containing protein [Planctomycetota bacterium]